MSIPTKPLLGASPEAIWHEQNRRQTRSQRIIPSADIVVEEHPHGTALRLRNPTGAGGGASGSGLTQYILKDWSYDDFLVCRELTANPAWDGDPLDEDRFTEGTDDIFVAKPPLFRQSEFDGLTITIPTEFLSGLSISTSDKFYKYTYYSSTFRLVEQLLTVGGIVLASEYQCILPRFTVDEPIYAAEVSDLQINDPALIEITLLGELPNRVWAKVLSPTIP